METWCLAKLIWIKRRRCTWIRGGWRGRWDTVVGALGAEFSVTGGGDYGPAGVDAKISENHAKMGHNAIMRKLRVNADRIIPPCLREKKREYQPLSMKKI